MSMRVARRAAIGAALRLAVVGFLTGALVPVAHSGPIATNTFLEFGFSDVGIAATGCDPADPAGPFCIPSGGTPTSFLDAPPWTFGTTTDSFLRVTDALESGDRFEVFDYGVSLGQTSIPGASDCGDDPVVCFADPAMSSGLFLLPAGAHSITLVATLAPSGGGSGYLVAVPEPGTLSFMLLIGLATVVLVIRRTRSRL